MLYRVLVVDNSNFDLRHYSSMPVFSECGFEITGHTSDPNKAVFAASMQEYDLLLCINRPSAVIATGLLKRAAKARLNIPVIVISKVDASNDMRECFLLGAVDYLTEPALEDDIRSALMRATKVVNRNITNAEYIKAMKDALSTIPLCEKNEMFIEKLRELLLKTQGTAVTVEEAADHFGFNPDYFGRYFKQRAGISFSDFYKKMTMEYAKLLLGSWHYKVKEVSDILGFSSPDYFTRVFRKVTGELPSEYKN